MPIGEHRFRCHACGKYGTCGDCIPEFCWSCQQKVDANHPGAGCPCWDCSRAETERQIQAKLTADERDRYKKMLADGGKFRRLPPGV